MPCLVLGFLKTRRGGSFRVDGVAVRGGVTSLRYMGKTGLDFMFMLPSLFDVLCVWFPSRAFPSSCVDGDNLIVPVLLCVSNHGRRCKRVRLLFGLFSFFLFFSKFAWTLRGVI